MVRPWPNWPDRFLRPCLSWSVHGLHIRKPQEQVWAIHRTLVPAPQGTRLKQELVKEAQVIWKLGMKLKNCVCSVRRNCYNIIILSWYVGWMERNQAFCDSCGGIHCPTARWSWFYPKCCHFNSRLWIPNCSTDRVWLVTNHASLHTIPMMQMMTIFCVQTALQRSLNECLHYLF